jgi:hypothetical protein
MAQNNCESLPDGNLRGRTVTKLIIQINCVKELGIVIFNYSGRRYSGCQGLTGPGKGEV